MAEEEPKEGQTANAAPDPFVDDELHAAEGIRKNAERIASALGALPGLAIITSLVRAPGEEGFEPWKIVLGVGLAALGAIVGIRAFADVMAPADPQGRGPCAVRNVQALRQPIHHVSGAGRGHHGRGLGE